MITISGTEVEISKDSLSIDDAIEERTTCSFTVVDAPGQHYKKGQPVNVWEDGLLIFAGVIDTAQERKITQTELCHIITCADWHYLADKRIVAKAYQNTTAGAIVRDIVTTYLTAEGVTVDVDSVQDGPEITEAVFNYVTVSSALDSLAEKSGFWWMIDQFKTLYFVARSTNTAPYPVSNADMEKDSISVEHGNPMYRNKQYIKGGTDITDPQTVEFKGDSKQKTFSTGYKIAKVPIVKVNSVSQTVGIRGLDTGKQWYWSKGETAISQDDSGTAISSTDILSVTYQGEFSVVVISIDQVGVLGRQTVEGFGTGLVEDVADEPQSTSREAAFQSASAKLEKYGVIGRRLSFRTWKPGLEVGQILTVNLPEHDLIGAGLLIESAQITK